MPTRHKTKGRFYHPNEEYPAGYIAINPAAEPPIQQIPLTADYLEGHQANAGTAGAP
ncbi:MAG: hypothetical protein QHH07_05790 [Sedimentisphaerales bacterium]|nr:hypothetical protein [Sedimentisphaerales bacterium]